MPSYEERTWTEHTFRCVDCGRISRASQEVLDQMRRDEYIEPDTTDAALASNLQFCLACNGIYAPGEHVGQTFHCYTCGRDDVPLYDMEAEDMRCGFCASDDLGTNG